jgi:G3E family GTPase
MQGAPKKAVEPVPVILLTGFLGSGKTTLLNDLVRQPSMANTMVIINEFGDIGLDHLLVAHSYDDTVVEMSSGCLCCTIRKDLVKTLRDVTWRFSRMGRRSFDRVIIETTGLADPAPILQTLQTDPFIRAHYRLDGVATAIDMATGDGTLSAYSEAVKQAAVADLLLLTKADIASAEEIQHLEERLRTINPAAEQLFVDRGCVDADTLLEIGLFDAAGRATRVRPWLNTPAYEEAGPVQRNPEMPLSAATYSSTHVPAGAHEHAHDSTHDDMHSHTHNQMHEHSHDPNRHDDEIRAFCFQFEQPLDERALDDWKAFILPLLGQNMLRIKGILNISGNALPTVIHGVQHIFHTPIQLESWPDEDRRTRLVFITRGIERSVIEGTLRVFLRAARI